MAEIVLTHLERDCIACPTIWKGDTQDGREVMIRYRWGDLSIRCADTDPRIDDEVFSQAIGDGLDGHMTLYDLRDILADSTIEFDVALPTEFYDEFFPEDCEFVLFGNFIDTLDCEECEWERDGDTLEEFEYETVLPPVCLSCGGEYEVTEKTPDHLKELQEKAKETSRDDVIDNLEESLSEE